MKLRLNKNTARILGVALAALGFVVFCCLISAEIVHAQSKLPMRSLEFSWEPVEKAKGYELQFIRSSAGGSAAPINFTSATNGFKGELPVGQYKIKIRTLDSRGVPGTWSAPIPVSLKLPIVEALQPEVDSTIQGDDSEAFDVSFSWKSQGEAVQYVVTVLNGKGKKVFEETVEEPKAQVKLNVAQGYQWRVTAKLEDGFKGEEWEQSRSFVLLGSAIESPEMIAKYSSEKPTLKWARPKFAVGYRVEFISSATGNDKGEKWKEVLKDEDYKKSDFKVPAEWQPGKYRLKVVALANLRGQSKPLEHEFVIEEAMPLDIQDDDEAKVKGTVSTKKSNSPHHFEAGYTYAPMLRSISVASDDANAAFNVFVSSSNVISGSYVFAKGWQAMGVSGAFHHTKKNIFESATSEDAPGQKALNIDTADVNFMAAYKIVLWRIGLGPDIGIQKRSVFLLEASNNSSFALQKLPMTEVLAGGSLGLYLESGTRFAMTFLKGSPSGKTLTTSYSRSVLTLGLAQPLISKNLLLTGGFTNDTASFEYKNSSDTDLYSAKWSNNIVNIGLSFAF